MKHSPDMGEVTCHAISLDDRGEVGIPREVFGRHGRDAGTSLIAVDSNRGVIVMPTDEALS